MSDGKIRLLDVRISFANLFTPKSVNGGAARYGANFLIPKDSPQIAQINAVIEEVAKEKWGKDAAKNLEKLRPKDLLCLRDGNDKEYDGYEDCMYIAANAGVKARPTVLDSDLRPLVETDSKIYAGCYVNAILVLWVQDDSNGKRINAQLKGVMFKRDGDAFAGSGPLDPSEFADLAVTDDDTAGLLG